MSDVEAAVRAEHVVRTYRVRDRSGKVKHVEAVKGIDVSVPRGGSLAIVGESGSGKSTLARMLVGMERPDSGSVYIEGKDFYAASRGEYRRMLHSVQMIFQDPYRSLNPRMTVRGSLKFAYEASGRPGSQFAAECERLLGLVRLPVEHLYRRPTALSGGERQRVSIARALMVNPEIIVADEAVSALDRSVQADVLNLIADLRAELGLTLLYITHDLHTVQAVCEDVIVLHHGEVVERGGSREVLKAPQDAYTRALVEAAPSVEIALDRRGLVAAAEAAK